MTTRLTESMDTYITIVTIKIMIKSEEKLIKGEEYCSLVIWRE